MTRRIDDIYAQIKVCKTEFRVSFSSESDSSAPFQLQLCRKQTSLGNVEVDQFWMPIYSLYGQRNSRAVNQQPIVDLWWAMCGSEGTQTHEKVQESYLLAKILPHARSNGSRRVLLDSVQTVPATRHARTQLWVRELNQRLFDSRSEEFDEVQFRDATANFIGPPYFSSEVCDKYWEMTNTLFGEAHEALSGRGTESFDSVVQDWKKLMTQIGRRRGNAIEKQVLDMLSYECRTALHRCYSGVWWSILLPALADHYNFSDESYFFHRLWHLDRCRESNHGDQAYFHLFHGHIFALHPACGPVLLTHSGAELFGAWLREGSLSSYHRVLHALAVAVNYYAEQHDIVSLLRQNAERLVSVGDVVALEEQLAEQRSGRRRRYSND